MPEEALKTPLTPKQQAVDVVAKPVEEKPVQEVSITEQKQPEPKKAEDHKPKKPIGAIIMALLIGGSLIAVALLAQLQK